MGASLLPAGRKCIIFGGKERRQLDEREGLSRMLMSTAHRFAPS